MPKIRIPVEQLPPPNKEGDHLLQFRVISEDRNQTSAWSTLYTVKSVGQYRPKESDVVLSIGGATVDATWDTPYIYNFVSASPDLSVVHNHTQNFKRHETDIFVQWGSGSVMSNFEYHDRVDTDSTSIAIPYGFDKVRIVALVAVHGLPEQGNQESDSDFGDRIDEHVNYLLPVFKIFDTDIQSLT